jgi:hypothetical protein
LRLGVGLSCAEDNLGGVGGVNFRLTHPANDAGRAVNHLNDYIEKLRSI